MIWQSDSSDLDPDDPRGPGADATPAPADASPDHLTGEHAPYLQLLGCATAAILLVTPATAPSVWDDSVDLVLAPAPDWVKLVWAVSDRIHATGTVATYVLAVTIATVFAALLWIAGHATDDDDVDDADDATGDARTEARRAVYDSGGGGAGSNDGDGDGSGGEAATGAVGQVLSSHEAFPLGTVVAVFVVVVAWVASDVWSPLSVSDGEPGRFIHCNLADEQRVRFDRLLAATS